MSPKPANTKKQAFRSNISVKRGSLFFLLLLLTIKLYSKDTDSLSFTSAKDSIAQAHLSTQKTNAALTLKKNTKLYVVEGTIVHNINEQSKKSITYLSPKKEKDSDKQKNTLAAKRTKKDSHVAPTHTKEKTETVASTKIHNNPPDKNKFTSFLGKSNGAFSGNQGFKSPSFTNHALDFHLFSFEYYRCFNSDVISDPYKSSFFLSGDFTRPPPSLI